MKKMLLASSLIGFMALVPDAHADPPRLAPPKLLSPAAGSRIALGGGFVVKFEPYPNARSYGCSIDQAPFGGGQWMHYDGADTFPTPECVVSAADVAKQFKPGHVNITIFANIGAGMDARTASNEVPFDLVFVAPTSDRPATPWDSRYKAIRNTAVDGTVLACPKDDAVYVAGGQFSIDLPVGGGGGSGRKKGGGQMTPGGDTAGGNNIVHLATAISPDGRFSVVVPLTAANLTAAKTQASFPPKATSLTMSGEFKKEDTSWQKNPGRPLYGKGRIATVKISLTGTATDTGATADMGCSFSMTADDYTFHEVDPNSFGSGGPKSSGSGKPGGGGSGDAAACEKSCFHAEATCTSGRGACMKTRQACVSACR